MGNMHIVESRCNGMKISKYWVITYSYIESNTYGELGLGLFQSIPIEGL